MASNKKPHLDRVLAAKDGYLKAKWELDSALLDGYYAGIAVAEMAQGTALSQFEVQRRIQNETSRRRNITRRHAERKARNRERMEETG